MLYRLTYAPKIYTGDLHSLLKLFISYVLRYSTIYKAYILYIHFVCHNLLLFCSKSFISKFSALMQSLMVLIDD